MKTKKLILIVAGILIVMAVYGVGYTVGRRHTVTSKEDAQFRLAMHYALYQNLQKGDMKRMQSALGMLVLGDVRAYEIHFGPETGTNRFARTFREAQAVATDIESRLVPVSLSTVREKLQSSDLTNAVTGEKER